jgi:hypothetical protein
MAIYPPTPRFSDADKRLLALLGRLLLERVEARQTLSNLPLRSIALSDAEAEELLRRITQLLSSKEFLEAAHFVEALTLGGGAEEAHARELYLSNRKRRGRSRAMASTHWLEFRARLGLSSSNLKFSHYTLPMSLDQFQEMERRLLQGSDLNPTVVELIMEPLISSLSDIQEMRAGNRPLHHGSLKKILFEPYRSWRSGKAPAMDREVSVRQVSATILLVADVSVLFTTRDWSVAGTLSTMAGAAIELGSG